MSDQTIEIIHENIAFYNVESCKQNNNRSNESQIDNYVERMQQPLIWDKLKEKFNKTGTSQVGAISKAQKAQNLFIEKKLEVFEKKFFRKMSRSAEKCERGSVFDLQTRIL